MINIAQMNKVISQPGARPCGAISTT